MYSLDMRLGGHQTRSGRSGEEKISYPAGNRTPAVQPIAIPTELPREYVNELHIMLKTGNFLDSSATPRFSKRPLLHLIRYAIFGSLDVLKEGHESFIFCN
jgi:hypothetical protein